MSANQTGSRKRAAVGQWRPTLKPLGAGSARWSPAAPAGHQQRPPRSPGPSAFLLPQASDSNKLLKILVSFLKMLQQTGPWHSCCHRVDVRPSSIGTKEPKTESSVLRAYAAGVSLRQGSHALCKDPGPSLPSRFNHLVTAITTT